MKLVILGGGAAGMMAAGRALELGAQVTVVEHARKPMLKLGITGKGRCNLTNDTDLSGLVKNTVHNGKFLYGAFSRFDAQKTKVFFEQRGVPLKTERGARVFPVSDRAFDIVDALRSYAKNAQIVSANAEHIAVSDGRAVGVRTDKGYIPADAVILATGGRSYAPTGSDGSGYGLAVEHGHTLIEPEPSLVPLDADRALCQPLAGLSLKNVEISLVRGGKVFFREMGELLFTHTGVSGPIVLSASVHMRGEYSRDVTAFLDLKPAIDAQTLDQRLLREIADAPNTQFSTLVPKLLPKSMTAALCDVSGISPGTKLHSLTREQRHALGKALKNFPLAQVSKRGFDEAVVTAGGLSVKQIDPKTMGSKLVENLYFAGEIMDIDGYTGGFNLQIAWSSARAAAEAACAKAGSIEERNTKMVINIALDGPSGSGKSTMAKKISDTLGFYYIDTGALYRAVGLLVRREEADPDDEAEVAKCLEKAEIRFDFSDGVQHTFLNGEDVSAKIRTPEISDYASRTSALPCVRAALLRLQQDFAKTHSVIMDGRDIGTTVLPDAQIKIFLTASAEARAERRYKELVERGEKVEYAEVLEDMKARDERDTNREISPLRRASDAIEVDTTHLDIDRTLDTLLSLIRERMDKK